jgi:uncharacterized repeat protein (TIGR03803 family)
VLATTVVRPVTAQTYTTIYSFSNTPNTQPFTNSGGANPVGGLVLSNTTLYGTTEWGGAFGDGTVFSVNTDGAGFTNLHVFSGGSDGQAPECGLVLSGNTLYGTATYGGSGGGTVFRLNTDGTGFTNIHNFTASDGVSPFAGLILSGNTLYGTTQTGGQYGHGTVFAVYTDGTGFTNLHSFNPIIDGGSPISGLVLSGSSLYGTALQGGHSGHGTVFSLNSNGTGFTNLHNFTGTSNDGAAPQAGLVLVNSTLYGTTSGQGGTYGYGTVFAINTDGSGYTNLHSFNLSDGAGPDAATLLLSGDTLYGTADYGGSFDGGTVFAIGTDGSGFTNLHNFMGTEGYTPLAGLVLTNNTLYGTAVNGGSSGGGAVFSLSFAPQLTITPSGANVLLSWPTNFAGFDYTGYMLQSTTNLVSSVWTTNLPAPVFVNGQNTVTNPIAGPWGLYRLMQ